MANEFQKTVSRTTPVGEVATRQVDTSLAKAISFVGENAIAAAKGLNQAKLEGTEEQEVPTREVVDVGSVPAKQFSAAIEITDIGAVIPDEFEGPAQGDIFSTKTVIDPDVQLSFNQIKKARDQGLLTADEAEARVRASVRSAVNRLPGQAAELKRAAGEFFGRFGPGGGALSETAREKFARRLQEQKMADDFEVARLSAETGIPEKEIRRTRSRAQIAQWNKLTFGEDLSRYTSESNTVVTSEMNKVIADTFTHIKQQGGVLNAQSKSAILAQMGRIRTAALTDLEKSKGYRNASFSDKKAAKDSLNAIYDNYASILSTQDADKTLTSMFTELSMSAKLNFSKDYPRIFKQVQALGPELTGKVWETYSTNPELYKKVFSDDPADRELVQKKMMSDPTFLLTAELWKDNFEAWEKLESDLNDKTITNIKNRHVSPNDPQAGAMINKILETIGLGSTVDPRSEAGQAATETLLKYGDEVEYLSLTRLATPQGRSYVLGHPAGIPMLKSLVTSRLQQDYMVIRYAALEDELGPAFLGATEFDESSQFLGALRDIRRTRAETARAKALENSNLTTQLLQTYPEIWRDNFDSPQEYMNDIFDSAKASMEGQLGEQEEEDDPESREVPNLNTAQEFMNETLAP